MTLAKTILTVDDSRTMRDMLALTLSESGYRVVQAVDGVEGLAALKNETVDVIITDINMPRLDGFAFIEQVRSDPQHRGTPILVLTTESGGEMKDKARKSGASGWIVKPFNSAKLLEAVRRVGA